MSSHRNTVPRIIGVLTILLFFAFPVFGELFPLGSVLPIAAQPGSSQTFPRGAYNPATNQFLVTWNNQVCNPVDNEDCSTSVEGRLITTAGEMLRARTYSFSATGHQIADRNVEVEFNPKDNSFYLLGLVLLLVHAMDYVHGGSQQMDNLVPDILLQI